MTDLALKHGLSFADLYDREGLVRLDRAFVAHLVETDIGLHDRLMAARRDPDAVERLEESNLLVDLAPYLEDFIGELFGIEAEVHALQARHHELAPLYSVKRLFVQRRAVKGVKEVDATAIDGRELDQLMGSPSASSPSHQSRRSARARSSRPIRSPSLTIPMGAPVSLSARRASAAIASPATPARQPTPMATIRLMA